MKSLGGGGGSRVSGKIARGSTYFAFYCIFINKFFKNLPERSCFIPPLCASMAKESKGKKWKERKGDREILVLERGREKEVEKERERNR